MFTVFGIAVGLAMDAFAVSISYGCGLRTFSPRVMLWVSAAFAFFQGGMTLAGWAAGSLFAAYIQAVDHYIAFGLLAFIGGKMIWEAFTGSENCEHVDPRAINIKRLLVLSVATSIDALAVGLSFALLEVRILAASLIIAAVTLAFSMFGVKTGHSLQRRFGRKVEIAGGLILILIGARILITHLQAA